MALDQVVIGHGDIGHCFAATNDQIGNRARPKIGVGLNQGDLNAVVRPHANIFCCRSTTIATTHDHHFGATAATDRCTTGHQSQSAECRAC